ncbi:hypothetical protein [Herbidospora mongoliensis]|uniref:hypothetical protein n=1 Tax=Herbidospora mongoliensis TaxID=688067 RepID=UPI0008361F7D|nr:hypothetical protein [Herbidospora mongoliensis]
MVIPGGVTFVVPYTAEKALLLIGGSGEPGAHTRRRGTTCLTARHSRDTRPAPVRRSARGVIPVGADRPRCLRDVAMADALAVVPPGWAGGPVESLAVPA